MQNVAQAWLIYRLTESSFMLGLAAFCGLVPVLLFSLLGGVLADHINRRHLLIVAHSAGLIQALLLGYLTLSGLIMPWHILVFSTVLGIIHAFEMPARHSFLSDMVTREDLANAIALNASAFNIARFIGPSLAGVLIGIWDEGVVFIINAASFVAVLIAFLAMRMNSVVVNQGSTENAFKKIQQGLHFVWKNRQIRFSLMLLSVFSIVGTALTVLMPVFTRETFHGHSEVLGLLLGAAGGGALIGALLLAYHASFKNLPRQIGSAGLMAGICLSLFPLVNDLNVALLVMAMFGFCQTILAASTNTLIQSLVSDTLRGRVMSVFSMVFIGFMPVGSISSGYIAEHLGVDITVHSFGVISIIVAAVYLFRTRLWRARVA